MYRLQYLSALEGSRGAFFTRGIKKPRLCADQGQRASKLFYSLAIASPEPPVSHRLLEVIRNTCLTGIATAETPTSTQSSSPITAKTLMMGRDMLEVGISPFRGGVPAASCKRDRLTCHCHESIRHGSGMLVHKRAFVFL